MSEPFWPQDAFGWLKAAVMFQTMVGTLWFAWSMWRPHADIFQPLVLVGLAFVAGPVSTILGVSAISALIANATLVVLLAIGSDEPSGQRS
jgi:hypothetical protein